MTNHLGTDMNDSIIVRLYPDNFERPNLSSENEIKHNLKTTDCQNIVKHCAISFLKSRFSF